MVWRGDPLSPPELQLPNMATHMEICSNVEAPSYGIFLIWQVAMWLNKPRQGTAIVSTRAVLLVVEQARALHVVTTICV